MKKILFLCLLLCLTLPLLAACKGDSNGGANDTPPVVTLPPANPTNPNTLDLEDSVITRPQKTVDILTASGREIANTVTKLSGKTVTFKDDISATTKVEILIGETNRAESAAAKAALGNEKFAFIIQRSGKKIAIVGSTLEMTVQGVEYFIKNILSTSLSEEGKLDIAEDFSYIGKSEAHLLIDNGASGYQIVVTASQMSNTLLQQSEAVKDIFRAVTGKSMNMVPDAAAEDAERNSQSRELLLGATYYPETMTVKSKLGYGKYGVALEGNKLVVFGYSDYTLGKAVELLEDIVKRNTVGKTVTLPADLFITLTDSTVKLTIPAFPSALQSMVDVEGDTQMVYIPKTTLQKLQAYEKLLEADGMTKYAENTLGNVKCVTYAGDKLTVNCSFDASDNSLRIIADKTENRPTTAEKDKYTEKCDTLLIQSGLNYMKADTGMGYIMRLADGRFLIIDGGSDDYDDYKRMYDLLVEYNVNEGKPVVAAWLLTHAHEDHYGAFLHFAEVYCKQQVVLERVIYNLPSAYFCDSLSGEINSIDKRLKALTGTNHIYARTGQKFHFGGTVIEVLLTPEDFYPATTGNDQNDSSVVYRITSEGQTFMVLGDSAYKAAPILMRRYGNTLKSDLMQVAHHGYDGVDALYRLIDPTVILWPCPDNWFHEAQRWDEVARWIFNKYLVTSPNVTEIINSGHGTAVLTLPYTGKTTQTPTYNPGQVIYVEDFESLNNLYQVGWCVDWSLLEDRTYTEVALLTKNGDKGLFMQGYKNSLLACVRPDYLEGVDKYTLSLTLNVESLGQGFGIRFNNQSPIDPNSALYAQYNITRTGSMLLTLEVDCVAGTTKVYINNQYQTTLQNTGEASGGIAFYSMYAAVFVGRVSLTAGSLSDL